MNRNTIKFKIITTTLLSSLTLWAVLVTAQLFFFTVYQRESYLEKGSRIAWRHGTIPAVRGKIIDKNGLVLAWTEKYFDLMIDNNACKTAKRKLIIEKLKKVIGNFKIVSEEDRIILKKSLNPDEIRKLAGSIEKYPEIRLIPRYERCYVDYPEVRKYLGTINIDKSRFRGQTGLELVYDKQLNGSSGTYVIMLDHHGEWIPGTWKMKKPVVPGKNIQLKLTLNEIKQNLKRQ